MDVEDGTQNAYVPFKKYLEKEVKRACEIAHAFETKLIRGFSFYHPGAPTRANTCRKSSISSGRSPRRACVAT